ncbi:hypothetical protein KI387_038218, partial [Taxus chinensis]
VVILEDVIGGEVDSVITCDKDGRMVSVTLLADEDLVDVNLGSMDVDVGSIDVDVGSIDVLSSI